jgi:hypothetical protein
MIDDKVIFDSQIKLISLIIIWETFSYIFFVIIIQKTFEKIHRVFFLK